jgi:hypothetical protein
MGVTIHPPPKYYYGGKGENLGSGGGKGGNLSSPPTDPALCAKTCHEITENTIAEFVSTR